MWVKIVGKQGVAYRGELLNAPHKLQTVALGSRILFLVPPEIEHPFRVTEKYLAEREQWDIAACNKCGFPELFDAPSDLMRKVFPDLPPDGSVEMFTSFCPLCGGVQGVEAKDNYQQNTASNRPWWRFWG